jgi:hydrogenase maturation protease
MIRIIGLGSPFGDDDVGWRVIDAMRSQVDEGVDLVALDRPGALLADRLCDVDHLVVVDALQDPRHVGIARRVEPADLAGPDIDCGSHQLRLADQLALAAVLGWQPETVELWTVSIGSLGHRSPDVSRAVARLARRLAEAVRGWR